jgi:hypothetical protein
MGVLALTSAWQVMRQARSELAQEAHEAPAAAAAIDVPAGR